MRVQPGALSVCPPRKRFTPIDSLIDRDGASLPGLVVLAIDLDPQWVASLGSAMLKLSNWAAMPEALELPLENEAELVGVLSAAAVLDEQRTPVEPASIAHATGLELALVKELMAEAKWYGLAFYVNVVGDRTNSPIHSWDGWTVTELGYRFLVSADQQ